MPCASLWCGRNTALWFISLASVKMTSECRAPRGGSSRWLRLPDSSSRYSHALFFPLTETYAMIDSCDSSIACWSEDGKTFIVKNTSIFEKQTIPTFFKHSKFSSFVRQLNFYGYVKSVNDYYCTV